MESKQPEAKPLIVERMHAKITEQYASSKNLKQTAPDLQDLGRNLSKMNLKYDMKNCQSTMDQMFTIASEKMESEHDKEVLKGLRQMVNELEHAYYRPQPKYQDAFFFPNMANVKKVVKYISMAKRQIDLSIFSFTNDDLANEIIAAHKRGVAVRIITDDEAMKGKGADAQRCSDAGIPVRTDSEERFHMHNKFMVVDQTFLLTGSFNWTFQAGKSNQENVIIVDGDYYIEKYNSEFNKIWSEFSANELERKESKAATTIQKQWKGKKAAKPKQRTGGWGLE
mgnify:CR=1 FL=1|jgi:phosphatidylserine/phosphatidylglycerophosphate/cardiolipin synthase-like enzyme